MRDVPDTTGNPKYDDTGRVEIKSFFLYGDDTVDAVSITAEVYSLQGYPTNLFIKQKRYRLVEHRPLHAEYIYTVAA